jgi:hypothetical protein
MTDASAVLIAAPAPAKGTARLCCVAIKDPRLTDNQATRRIASLPPLDTPGTAVASRAHRKHHDQLTPASEARA